MHFQRSKSFLESPKSVFNVFVQVIAWFVVIFRNCFTQFHEPLGEWNLRQFWNITSGIYAKYYVQIMLLFVYTTTHKRFVIFTCRYFKLSGNTTALSQSNCRIFSWSSMNEEAVFLRTLPSIFDASLSLVHLFFTVTFFLLSRFCM